MKEIREKTISDVLDTLDYDLDGIQTKGTRKASKDRAEAEIKKIVLGWVGSNRTGNNTDYTLGYNQAKVEIRSKIC